MGYKGYQEIICSSGHYECRDDNCYSADDPYNDPCKVCGEKVKFRHTMDVTNGYNEDHEYSCRAPKVEVSFTDEWRVDHYNNKYAVKHLTYAPDPKTPKVWNLNKE